MKTLAIDIETYSSVDLLKSGVYRYAEAPDFDVLLLGYAYDDDEVHVLDLAQGDSIPDGVLADLTRDDVLKTAFNAAFERTCLAAYLKVEMPPAQWGCTAVMARELGLPGSLEGAGLALGLPDDQLKLRTGRALIRYFCNPCMETKTNGGRTRNMPWHDIDKWNLFVAYNRQDVEAERAIRKKLMRYAIHDGERTLWEIDQRINDRGVRIDSAFAQKAIEFDDLTKDRLITRAREVSGLDNPKSAAQVKAWIETRTGVRVESLGKEALPDVRAKIDDAQVGELLDLRASITKTSIEKYRAMLRSACRDDRVRGATQFCGAGRTGRWAGRIVQLQNLPKNTLPDADLDNARALIRAGLFDSAELLFADVPGTLSQLVRTALIPRDGCVFTVSDFSAIEARVLAWFADEQWRMDVFNGNGKIYEASAEHMFHLPEGSIKKGDPLRQKGKIAELALGYGGAVGAMVKMGALQMGLTNEELPPLVKQWRGTNKAITKFWWDVDKAVRACIMKDTIPALPHGLCVRRDGPLMRILLPSGREISYVQPAIVNDKIHYMGANQETKKWERIESYGPKFVENIVQATARDCLAESMRRLEAAGYDIVFHVHDEVIIETPAGEEHVTAISELMGQAIDWVPGLPLRADAYQCEYYRKD